MLLCNASIIIIYRCFNLILWRGEPKRSKRCVTIVCSGKRLQRGKQCHYYYNKQQQQLLLLLQEFINNTTTQLPISSIEVEPSRILILLMHKTVFTNREHTRHFTAYT